jgi:hypothetical protein
MEQMLVLSGGLFLPGFEMYKGPAPCHRAIITST